MYIFFKCTLCIICKQANMFALLKLTQNYNLQKNLCVEAEWFPFTPKHPKVKYKMAVFTLKVKVVRYEKHATDLWWA